MLIASALLALIAGPLSWALVMATRGERDLSLALDRASSAVHAARRVLADGSASTGFVALTAPDGQRREAFKRRDGRFVAYAADAGRLTRTILDATGRALATETVARDVRYLHLVALERGLHLALDVQPDAPATGAAPRRLEVATAVPVRGW